MKINSMPFVSDSDEISKCKEKAIDWLRQFEGSSSASSGLKTVEIDSDCWSVRGFWDFVQEFCRTGDDPDWWVMVLDPDPSEFYLKKFGAFPLIKASELSSEKDYFKALITEPIGAPSAAAITHIWYKVICFGNAWAGVFEYDEPGILFVNEDGLQTQYIQGLIE